MCLELTGRSRGGISDEENGRYNSCGNNCQNQDLSGWT